MCKMNKTQTHSERVINLWSRGEAHIGSSGETKVLCPSCRHIDHNNLPTLNFNVFKEVGRCLFCNETFTLKQLIVAGKLIARVSKAHSVTSPRQEQASEHKVQAPSTDLWTPLNQAKGVFADKARTYLQRRGVTEDMVFKYNIALGKTYGQDSRLWGRVVFPLYEEGKLVYYQARTIGKGGIKYLNPTKDDGCVGKSEVVGYIDSLKLGQPFIITEGLMSAWGAAALFGCAAVASLGKTISDTQAVKIAKKNPGRCTLMFDPDVEPSQLRDAKKKLVGWGIPVDTVHLKENQGDPWDLFVTKSIAHKVV